MKKLIPIIIVISLVVLVTAGLITTTTKLTFSKEQLDTLNQKGIINLKVIEYKCAGDNRCFKFDGDLTDNLVNIPKEVCIGYVKTDKIIYVLNKEGFRVPVHQRLMTGKCIYRDLTDDEIYDIIDKAVMKRINDITYVEDTSNYKDFKYGDRIILSKE